MAGTGIDFVPNLPACPLPVCKSVPVPSVPVSISYRTYRAVRYRYPYRTELTKVSGTGIDVVQNLLKCPAPVIPAVCLGTYHIEHTLGILLLFVIAYDTCTAAPDFFLSTLYVYARERYELWYTVPYDITCQNEG